MTSDLHSQEKTKFALKGWLLELIPSHADGVANLVDRFQVDSSRAIRDSYITFHLDAKLRNKSGWLDTFPNCIGAKLLFIRSGRSMTEDQATKKLLLIEKELRELACCALPCLQFSASMKSNARGRRYIKSQPSPLVTEFRKKARKICDVHCLDYDTFDAFNDVVDIIIRVRCGKEINGFHLPNDTDISITFDKIGLRRVGTPETDVSGKQKQQWKHSQYCGQVLCVRFGTGDLVHEGELALPTFQASTHQPPVATLGDYMASMKPAKGKVKPMKAKTKQKPLLPRIQEGQPTGEGFCDLPEHASDMSPILCTKQADEKAKNQDENTQNDMSPDAEAKSRRRLNLEALNLDRRWQGDLQKQATDSWRVPLSQVEASVVESWKARFVDDGTSSLLPDDSASIMGCDLEQLHDVPDIAMYDNISELSNASVCSSMSASLLSVAEPEGSDRSRCFHVEACFPTPDGYVMPADRAGEGSPILAANGKTIYVTSIERTPPQKFLVLVTEEGVSLRATESHRIVVQRGMYRKTTQAKNLREGDAVFINCHAQEKLMFVGCLPREEEALKIRFQPDEAVAALSECAILSKGYKPRNTHRPRRRWGVIRDDQVSIPETDDSFR